MRHVFGLAELGATLPPQAGCLSTETMKAKDFANRFINAHPTNSSDELSKILLEFWKETQSLAKARNAKTLSAMVNIVRQQDEKYRTFSAIINSIQPIINNASYRMLIKEVDESLYWATFEAGIKYNIPHDLPI